MSDFFDSFVPVAPGPREHDWRMEGATRARCTRCGMAVVARLSQTQPGHAVHAEVRIEGSGELYRGSRCRR